MKKHLFLIISFILITTLQLNTALSSTTPNLQNGFADLVEKAMPAVVNISTTQKSPSNENRLGNLPFPFNNMPNDFQDLFDRFFGELPDFDSEELNSQQLVSLGSGFIIDEHGYIVTNHHVIDQAEEITVKLSDERKFKAKIIGSDQKTDLALLKIDTKKNLPFVKFGNSDDARVGEWVVAIGNPFGLEGTATTGIISARARSINAGLFDDFIQTDAAINRGNSGGPMFNMKGEVIGINTAIFSPSGGSVGIGFAISSSLAKPIIEQLKKGIKIKRGWLGIVIQPVTEEIKESLGLENAQGVLVAGVSKNSPSEKGNMKIGDIIIEFDGKRVANEKKLQRMVAETPVGKTVDIIVMRNKKKKKLSVKIEENIDKSAKLADRELDRDENNKLLSSTELFGVTFAKLTPEIKKNQAIDNNITGVIVTKINKKSSWAKKGVFKGDVISTINHVPITEPKELETIIKAAKKSGKQNILVLIHRKNQTIFLPLPINE